MKTLVELKNIVNEFSRKINGPNLSSMFGVPVGNGTPTIEIDDSCFYNYFIMERGREYERKKTADFDELLYWIFSEVTFFMACDYELKNRVVTRDCRRIIFAKQKELLGILSKKWEEKEQKRQQLILTNNPFDDF